MMTGTRPWHSGGASWCGFAFSGRKWRAGEFLCGRHAYYVINNNMGYEGDLELALIPESFRTDILKETLDDNGVLVENSEVELELFALLFEFDRV